MKSVARSRARSDSSLSSAQATAPARPKHPPKSRSGRESIESFVVVFVAFLIWSLEAEGFVIPTGSMAPTLMGRHKEIVCPRVRLHVYGQRRPRGRSGGPGAGDRPRGSSRGRARTAASSAAVADAPSFSGDRIYVMKQGLSLPFCRRGGPGQAQAVGRGGLQAARKSPRSATSSGWSACPTR